jgi:transcription antitermination factor NusG
MDENKTPKYVAVKLHYEKRLFCYVRVYENKHLVILALF